MIEVELEPRSPDSQVYAFSSYKTVWYSFSDSDELW